MVAFPFPVRSLSVDSNSALILFVQSVSAVDGASNVCSRRVQIDKSCLKSALEIKQKARKVEAVPARVYGLKSIGLKSIGFECEPKPLR
jgi:hypothetical protein